MLPLKKKICYYVSGFVLTLLLGACGQSGKEIARLMRLAEAVIEHQPDSALTYLRAVEDPDALWKARRMNYYLLWLQANDKTGRDISADTIICEVKDYFLRKKEFEKATLSAFYEGLVFIARKDDRRAIKAFLEAETIAGHLTNDKRKGLIQYNIGYLHYNSGTDYGKAAGRFKQAVDYFQAGNHYTYSIETLNLLGTCFLIQRQADSALFYQRQGLRMAEAHADTAAWTAALQSISVTYREMGEKQQAKQYALRATDFNKTNGAAASSLLNLAYIYYDCAQYDSAAFYANQILQLCEGDTTLFFQLLCISC
jgi:tetratricopeptide (TPR) repeat protein